MPTLEYSDYPSIGDPANSRIYFPRSKSKKNDFKEAQEEIKRLKDYCQKIQSFTTDWKNRNLQKSGELSKEQAEDFLSGIKKIRAECNINSFSPSIKPMSQMTTQEALYTFLLTGHRSEDYYRTTYPLDTRQRTEKEIEGRERSEDYDAMVNPRLTNIAHKIGMKDQEEFVSPFFSHFPSSIAYTKQFKEFVKPRGEFIESLISMHRPMYELEKQMEALAKYQNPPKRNPLQKLWDFAKSRYYETDPNKSFKQTWNEVNYNLTGEKLQGVISSIDKNTKKFIDSNAKTPKEVFEGLYKDPDSPNPSSSPKVDVTMEKQAKKDESHLFAPGFEKINHESKSKSSSPQAQEKEREKPPKLK